MVRRPKSLNIYLGGSDLSSNPDTSRVVHLILRSLPLLPNISFLRIDVRRDEPPYLTRIIREIMFCPMANTLQCLGLTGCVERLSSLAECTPQQISLQRLTRLNLFFVDNQMMDAFGNPISTRQCSSSHTVPVLLLLAPTLRFLSIQTSVDLAPIFDALNQSCTPHSSIPFPNLHSLHLDLLPFTKSMQSSPGSLRRFLLAHNKHLKHLYFKLQISRERAPGVNDSLGAWFSELVDTNYPFPTLESLDRKSTRLNSSHVD